MFKNNKEQENNFISADEVEKIYSYQKKVFDEKISEQQSQIEQLTNYLSARFGENVLSSNMSTKLNYIEKNLQDIQTAYKTELEITTKELKKQIEDESKKIATELNDSQTEAYFKLLQKNENDLAKIKDFVGERKDNDNKLFELDKTVKEHIQSNELFHQGVQQKLKEANQQIGKINYSGISNKFDKKLKEECSKFENKIEEAKKQTTEEIIKNSESIASLIGNLDERLSKEIVETEENLSNTTSLVNSLDKKISKEITRTNEIIENINESIDNTTGLVNDLDQRLSMEISTISKNIDVKVKSLEEEVLEKIDDVKINTENTTILVNNLEESNKNTASKFMAIDEELQKNQIAIDKLEESTLKGFEQAKQESKDAIKKLEESGKQKNTKTEEKIKQIKADIETVQNEAKKIEINWTAKLGEIQQETNALYTKIHVETDEKINTKWQEVITNLEKTKEELSEQLVNGHNENKIELQNIVSTVDILKNTMDTSFENIAQEVLRLKDEAKVNLEKQEDIVTDTELLKKEYNKFVAKMNNELAKIGKDILNAQKKNLETNQNLQVKIKAYIDNKIEKADNTQRFEELINKLNISIKEREKLQKIELEEMLNKKLKTIQKENERNLNKKIEEISNKFIRDNNSYTRTNPNNITIYKEAPKKKNMYDLIDENQILKRTAANKKIVTTSQEGKSQILKFFYDE